MKSIYVLGILSFLAFSQVSQAENKGTHCAEAKDKSRICLKFDKE